MLPHKLPNHVRLRIFRHSKIFKKILKLMKINRSSQSSSQNVNFKNSTRKMRKNRCQKLLFLSSFNWRLQFFQNIFSKIISANRFVIITQPIFLQTRVFFDISYNFWHYTSYRFSNFSSKFKVIQLRSSSRFNGFVYAVFCMLGLGQSFSLESF